MKHEPINLSATSPSYCAFTANGSDGSYFPNPPLVSFNTKHVVRPNFHASLCDSAVLFRAAEADTQIKQYGSSCRLLDHIVASNSSCFALEGNNNIKSKKGYVSRESYCTPEAPNAFKKDEQRIEKSRHARAMRVERSLRAQFFSARNRMELKKENESKPQNWLLENKIRHNRFINLPQARTLNVADRNTVFPYP